MLEKLKRLPEEWRRKSPKQKWQIIYRIGKILSELLGIQIYGDMQNYWFTYTSAIGAIFYLLSVFYTLWLYYDQDEFLGGLKCTCACGIAISALAVYFKSVGPGRQKVNNLLNFGGKYIYKDQKESPKYDTLCEQLIKKLLNELVVIVGLLIISFGLFLSGPAYLIIFENTRVNFIATELPYIDINSDIGFVAIILEQLSFTYMIGLAILAIEIGACLVNNATESFPEIIRLDLEELETDLNLNGMCLNIKVRLRNIFIRLEDFNGYLRECIDVYYIRAFMGPFFFAYCISVSIFCQLILDYPSGFGYAMCNYILLIILCYLGESNKQANQQIAKELYNMPWYILPPSCQTQLATAIQFVQNGVNLSIGPLGEINLEAAADLTKTIYRCTMMLMRLFK